jgi:RNA polymerase sigma-70 factor (ECF subfamily)
MENPSVLLIVRAQQGERQALDDLLALVQAPLHRYLTGLVGDAADDALQETLFRIARKLTWLTEPSAFRAWAYRIASREAQRIARRDSRMLPVEEVPEVAIEPVELSRWDDSELQRAVGGVSPASRAVLTLHYWHELPLDDVAAALEIPLGTVKSRLGYGLRQLRERLGGRG